MGLRKEQKPQTESESGHDNLRITIQELDQDGNVKGERHILLKDVLADIDHFDVTTLAGFRRDLNRAEQGAYKGFMQLLQEFMADYADRSEKNNGPNVP